MVFPYLTDRLGPTAGFCRDNALRTSARDVGQVAIFLEGATVEPGLFSENWRAIGQARRSMSCDRHGDSGSSLAPCWAGLSFAEAVLGLAAELADGAHAGSVCCGSCPNPSLPALHPS